MVVDLADQASSPNSSEKGFLRSEPDCETPIEILIPEATDLVRLPLPRSEGGQTARVKARESVPKSESLHEESNDRGGGRADT